MRQTFVFFHAHPDDEAIFTGGTIALLAAQGHRCVLVFATSGELGAGPDGSVGEVRREEAHVAAAILGAERVIIMDHHDSGLSADVRKQPWGSFAGVRVEAAADHLADILRNEDATALVVYDEWGVYGHPDHVHVHRVGAEAARRAQLATRYDVTVDREYLHFVDTHVAAVAGAAVEPLAAAARLGSTTVEIATTVDVRPALAAKHAAIAAHRSQIGDDPSLGSGPGFVDVYGYEWYLREGPVTALDALAVGPGTAARTVGARR